MKNSHQTSQLCQNNNSLWKGSLKNCFEVNINSSKLNTLICQIIDKVIIQENKISAINQKLNLSSDTLNKKIISLNMDFTQQLEIYKKKVTEDLHRQNLLITENDKLFQEKDRHSNNKFDQITQKIQALRKHDSLIAQEINRINQNIFGQSETVKFGNQLSLSQNQSNKEQFPIIKFGKRISSNISQNRIRPIPELLQQFNKRFIQLQKNTQEQLSVVKKQLRQAIQSQQQIGSQDEQGNINQAGRKLRKLNKKQKMMSEFAEKLDTLQYRVKDQNSNNLKNQRSRFDPNNGSRKSRFKRNGAYLRISGYQKSQSQQSQDEFLYFEKKITSLSEYLKGSIRQLQNQIDAVKNKCIVNDQKNGFVMRKVDKFHLENIELKNQIKKSEQSRIDDRAIQNIKNQFKIFMKEVSGFLQSKMEKEDYQKERQKLNDKIDILHQNLVQKADKGQVKKGLTFFEQRIKQLILVVAENQNFDEDGAARRAQLKCLSCDKELQGRVKGINLQNRICNANSQNRNLSMRTKTQNIRRRMKASPNTITQMQSDD